jgi:hypothetical protein
MERSWKEVLKHKFFCQLITAPVLNPDLDLGRAKSVGPIVVYFLVIDDALIFPNGIEKQENKTVASIRHHVFII